MSGETDHAGGGHDHPGEGDEVPEDQPGGPPQVGQNVQHQADHQSRDAHLREPREPSQGASHPFYN